MSVGKWIGVVVLALIAIGYLSNKGDDSAPAKATASSIASKPNPAAIRARRALSLATEGRTIAFRLADWAKTGSTDPITACASLDTAEADLARIGTIARSLRHLHASSPALRRSSSALARRMPAVRQGCRALGL